MTRFQASGAVFCLYIFTLHLQSWAVELNGVAYEEFAPLCNSTSFVCPPSEFSSFEGTCNNVHHKTWGASSDAFLRLFSPTYADGYSIPRLSVMSAQSLPHAEKVIANLNSKYDSKVDHPHLNGILPAWSQLLFYDLVDIREIPSKVECCNRSAATNSSEYMASCYVDVNENCKEYKRSQYLTQESECLLNRREQINMASAYIDGSGLYGNHGAIKKLRTFHGGMINTFNCVTCSKPGLVGALHTVLANAHNYIASELLELNPFWNDEKTFNEARKILVAQIQHITFNEFLPIVFGQEVLNSKELRLLSQGYYTKYSSTNRGGIFNEFAVAALPGFLSMLPEGKNNLSSPVEQLLNTPAKYKSFEPPNIESKEWQMLAYYTQMGRDHGIPAYWRTVNYCMNRKNGKQVEPQGQVKSFLYIPQEDVYDLQQIYQDLKDVDLIVGGLSEEPLLGALFGPTISCILALQFAKLRNSDRFWYENDLPPSSFSVDQLRSIRKATLSSLLCSVFGTNSVPPKAFLREDMYLNSRVACEHISKLDLSPWQVYPQHEDNMMKMNMIPRKEEHELGSELSPSLIKAAIKKAQDELLARKKFEYEAWIAQGGVDPRSPDGTAASFSKANRNALLIANSSIIYEFASNQIAQAIHKINRKKRQTFGNNLNTFSRDDITETLQTIDITSFISGTSLTSNLESQCEDFSSPCDRTSHFRTLSGHCNNLQNPTWGQSLTTFSRLLPAQYDDGISRPRVTSVTGGVLPNPRVISTLIHPDISNLHTRYSLMVMQYAQFLDHDLTLTPIHKGFHESIPSCRKCNSAQTVHPECNPFPVPAGDHYYPELNVTNGERLCFPFMRSLPGQQSLGPRDQINQNTAFLDSSQIYGENNCVANKLRGFSGRLNSTVHPVKGKELLPQSPFHPECKSPSGLCFIGGDDRASEQPGLTSIHTIFLREHNRIVEGLRGVNPHWSGDQLYEHARRIVTAQNQHITYNEFLPRILSWNAVNLYGLKLLSQGYYDQYNPSCNPAVFNEFAAAAFRIGHSLLRPHIPRLSTNHQPIDPPLLLRDGFFKMDALLQPGIIDEIARGLVSTPMETLDQFITGEVTNHLFEDRRIPFSGIDLIALNIQRGRDHGIPTYNNYRALCNLKRAQTWQDLNREIPPEVITRFKKIYASVDDIDLFPGAMTERPLQGGLVGPTLACIIGIQFRQLRKCDRFWYENNIPEIKFTEAQLAEIRKTTLAKIVCENLEISGDMQRAAFDLPSNFLNPRVPCQSMPQINLSAWRENLDGCQIGNRQVKIGESAFPSPCTSCVCAEEGPQCASLRITDCNQLLREWPRELILRDDVCSSQCGLVLQSGTFSAAIAGLNPPNSRTSRSRQTNSFGLKLPDLTPFLASL